MLFHLSYVVHTYLLYATTTGITFENSQLTFPDVLICNKNTVRRSMINNLTNDKFKKFLRLFNDAVSMTACLALEKYHDIFLKKNIFQTPFYADFSGRNMIANLKVYMTIGV